MYQKSISEISVMPYPFTNKTTSSKECNNYLKIRNEYSCQAILLSL